MLVCLVEESHRMSGTMNGVIVTDLRSQCMEELSNLELQTCKSRTDPTHPPFSLLHGLSDI